jgi:hypothetical protein
MIELIVELMADPEKCKVNNASRRDSGVPKFVLVAWAISKYLYIYR